MLCCAELSKKFLQQKLNPEKLKPPKTINKKYVETFHSNVSAIEPTLLNSECARLQQIYCEDYAGRFMVVRFAN